MTGIDVSAYQGEIQFHTLKQGSNVEFIYAKATEGESYVDEQFSRNKQVCEELSIPFGAYHFFRFTADPIAQAEHFIQVAGLDKGDLVPMVDVELGQFNPSLLSLFCQKIESHIGQKMLIYTFYGYWNGAANGYDGFNGHPFWIAEYNGDPQPTLPNGWNDWKIWQYSSTGSVAGIQGDVDLDRTNGGLLII